MGRVIKPKFTVEDLGINNFSDRKMLLIPVRRIYTRNAYTRNNVGDENNYYYEAERTEYTKVFTTAEARKRISQLSPAGKELFLWLIYTVEPGNDHIWINREFFMKEMGIKSNTTYVNSVKDLVKHNVIAPTLQVKDVYWLNPNFFFNGNRLNKYKENKIWSSKDTAEIQYEKDIRSLSKINTYDKV